MSQDTAIAIQAIASIVNLVIVVGFFVLERIFGKKNLEREKEEFWYRQTILDRGFNTLETCFGEMEHILQRANEYNTRISDENEKYMKSLVKEVKVQVFLLKRGILDYAKLFNSTFYKKLKENVEQLEDSVTLGIQDCYFAKEDTGDILSELSNCKYKIISELYKYDMNKYLDK